MLQGGKVTNTDQLLSHNRNLILACKRVNEAWFPVSKELLNRIREGVKSGTYDLDVAFLVDEIKTDFALFTHCLRALSKMVKEELVSPPPTSNPLEFMRWAGVARLKKILLADDKIISTHSLEEMNDVQSKRFQESMISASAAEVLSESSKIDPGIGFSTALLRQLGVTLVAWNYPKVYRRIFLSLEKERDLDLALTRELGFSPQLLGIAIARQWGLSPTLRAAIGDTDSVQSVKFEQTQQVKQASEFLAKICEIGEALARANSPEHYPTAKADWEKAKQEIESRLGAQGVRLIQNRLEENCESYIKAAPQLFKSGLELEPESKLHVNEAKISGRTNKYLKDCTPVVQALLREVYSSLDPNTIQKESIVKIANEVIPAAGFMRGCIFLLDPEHMALAPRLKIGDSKLSDYSVISVLSAAAANDPIASAYNSNTPLLAKIHGREQDTHFIAGVIGLSQRAGVLYLELGSSLLENPRAFPLLYFKAVNQALNDCLNLK